MKTKTFILKTLLPYKENPETCAPADDKSGCLYLTKDGRKCAVGRWMKKGEWQNSGNYAKSLFRQYGDGILKKEARDMKLSIDQWKLIQRYHDTIALEEEPNFIINSIVCRLEQEFSVDLPELRL